MVSQTAAISDPAGGRASPPQISFRLGVAAAVGVVASRSVVAVAVVIIAVLAVF